MKHEKAKNKTKGGIAKGSKDMAEELKEQIKKAFKAMGDKELFDVWRRLTTTIGNPNGMAIYRKEELNFVLGSRSAEDIVHILERSESYDSNDAFFGFYEDKMFSTNYLLIDFPPIVKNLDRAINAIVQKKLSLGSYRLQQVLDGKADESTFLPALEDIERVIESLNDDQIIRIHNKHYAYMGRSKEIVYPTDELSDVACYENESLAETIEKIVKNSNEKIFDNSRFSTSDNWFRCIDKECYFYESFSDLEDWGGVSPFEDLAFYIWDTDDDCTIPKIREVLDKHKKYGDDY